MSSNETGHLRGCRAEGPAVVPCKWDLLKTGFRSELLVRHSKIIGFWGQSQVPLPMYPLKWTVTLPGTAITSKSPGLTEMPAARLIYMAGSQLCEFSTPHNSGLTKCAHTLPTAAFILRPRAHFVKPARRQVVNLPVFSSIWR